jgi:hypothetical protein
MLALDLFNTKYEQDLREGAVDDLEARRIDTLNDRMRDLLARAKEPAYQANPAALSALKKQFQQVKDERDSYYKVREAGIPGSVPVEKIPGKEDLLKGRGRSYYEDQKKNSEQVDEYVSMGSDKNFVEAEPYKNYRIYVRKKPFGTTGMYTAHTEIDRKEFMGKGPSQQEAVQSIQDRIDFVLNAQRKVTGSSTIDFNVKFATDLLADPKQTFYAKLENINGEPKLVIASPEVASDPELLAAGDFKRSALRNQPDDSGRATPLPGIPLTAKGLRSGDWIANGRYTVGKETQDRDGNRVFDLTYHSTAHTKSDKLRLNQPAFTLGTAREVDEEKNTGPLDQKLQRLKVQARRQFPRAHTDDEALVLKLLDKETQDDQANRRTDARQDAELRKNFALDREQDDDIDNLQTQASVKEHGGGIGPKQRWQDLMPEQTNPEDYDDYEDEDQDTELRSGDYVRDTQDGESGEIFRMQGDPYERRVRILDRDGKGWYIEPSRLTRVNPTDPDVQRYFGKNRQRDMDEGQFSITNDPQAHAKILFLKTINGNEYRLVKQGATYKIYVNRSRKNKQEFPSFDLAKKALQQLLLNAVHTDEQGVAEGWSDRALAQRTGGARTPYGVYIDGKQWKEFATDDQARAVARKLEAKFRADGVNKKVSYSPAESVTKKDVKEDQDSSGVERAILNRIMVAHTDLLMKFGPDKVMQAAEEVAYNVGDVDEIGTSDVSAYVAQVKQILGATP